jgi:hypothetical protein
MSSSFHDEGEPDAATVYRPLHFDFYGVADARDRILHLLEEGSRGVLLDRLLPDTPDPAASEPRGVLQQRSAWSSTSIASLELTWQGDVLPGYAGEFRPIHVTR